MKKKSSEKRIEANRRNAQKSTGPRTPEGKARSAQNAVTHGLSSLSTNPLAPGCFLQLEDEAEFQGMLNGFLKTYQPAHQDELQLLTEAVYAKWRQQRGWAAETAQLEIAIARNERDLQRDLPLANANAHLANGFAHSEAMMRLYMRYDAQLHRHYKSCMKQLQDLQASRLTPDQPNPPQRNPDREEDKFDSADRSSETPNQAIPPAPAANTASPEEPKLLPKNDAQLFEEYRDRLLHRRNSPPQ